MSRTSRFGAQANRPVSKQPDPTVRFAGAGVFARGRAWLVLGLAALIVGLLSVFAVVMTNSQSQSRRETEKRFAAQATISAALTESLFASSAGQTGARDAELFGGKTISAEALTLAARRSQLRYLMILDGRGRLLGASAGTPSSARLRLATVSADVAQALHGHAALSDLVEGSSGAQVIEWASPVQTRYGRRVAVRGFAAGPIATFIDGYLARMATAQPDEQVALVDSQNRVIASASAPVKPGARLGDTELRAALVGHSQGSYQTSRGQRFFASALVGGSTWRVVASTPTKSFYPALSGSRAWVVWALFGAFAAALAAGLGLVLQTLRRKSQLVAMNRELAVLNSTLEHRVAERTAVAEQRAEQLARSNAELEQFAYVASHDLQEPLRKIQAFGDRLQGKHGDRLDAEGLDYLRRMQAAATRMRTLINDLLTFSRVASRAGEFAPVDLTAVAHEVVSDLEIQVEESGGRVDVGELPTIDADAEQMRRLLQNLIANALKFRRDGEPPLIRVQSRVLDGQKPTARNGFHLSNGFGPTCELTVEDNGIGFDEQYLERMFVIFQRLHGRTEYEGTGIGLAVCRKIVERHGGAITAAGTPGHGATFTITLPVAHQPEGAFE